jgi:hypothetical protein
MNYSLVAIEGDKFTMKAWDHENNCPVITTATYKGECDHPDLGTMVFVEFANKDCHQEEWNGDEKEETVEMGGQDFFKRIIHPVSGQYAHEESQATS